jgi:glycosyltransferase involved in cell wall biosynthesis/Tfp pilus assembly protein PilF
MDDIRREQESMMDAMSKAPSESAEFRAALARGVESYRRGDMASAAAQFEEARLTGGGPDLALMLAYVHYMLGNVSRSDHFFKEAIVLSPDKVATLITHGRFLDENGRTDEAIAAFDRALQQQPQNAEVLNDLGVLHFRKGDNDKAVALFQKASAINPAYNVPLVNLGYVYLAVHDIESAARLVERLTTASAGDAEVARLREQVAKARTGDAEKAGDTVRLRFSDFEFKIEPLRMIADFSKMSKRKRVGLSVVIPLLNEKDNVAPLYGQLTAVLAKLQQEHEIIFVNDGSNDGTREELDRIAKNDTRVKVIHFRRCYGQTAGLSAGFKYAQGDIVITMDGDLQNDPADIPKLLGKLSEGYDLVNGWRKDRKDKLLSRRIPSIVANRLINKLIEGTGVQLRDFGCSLKAYKSGIVKNIHLYGEMHRFIPVFAAWLGVKVAEIPVSHRPRTRGSAKYNLSRVSRVIFDLLVVRFFSDYMTRPIQFFGKIAKNLLYAGIAGIALLAVPTVLLHWPISLGTFIILAVLLLFIGLQIVLVGLIGEILVRSYFEIQNKDYYVVERIVNHEEQA